MKSWDGLSPFEFVAVGFGLLVHKFSDPFLTPAARFRLVQILFYDPVVSGKVLKGRPFTIQQRIWRCSQSYILYGRLNMTFVVRHSTLVCVQVCP